MRTTLEKEEADFPSLKTLKSIKILYNLYNLVYQMSKVKSEGENNLENVNLAPACGELKPEDLLCPFFLMCVFTKLNLS